MKWKGILFAILIVLSLALSESKYIKCVWGKDHSQQKNISLLADQWLSAVANNHVDTSIALARKIVHNSFSKSVPERYITLAEREGIKGSFFAAQFNFWDFQLWQQAYFFQQLSQDITKGNSNDINAMFVAVRKQIASHESHSPVPPWPYYIWQRGFGVCDRQAWVLCELAYQQGWETQIVYLRDPKTKISPHTICELRKPDGLVWFADPYAKILFPQKSVEDIARDNDLLQTMWSTNPNLRSAIQDCVFWTPSYPQDYCPRNQELYRILQGTVKDKCPRFGVPPEERLAAYMNLAQWTMLDQHRFPMQLWFYPFRLLRADIIRYCRQYGADFLK